MRFLLSFLPIGLLAVGPSSGADAPATTPPTTLFEIQEGQGGCGFIRYRSWYLDLTSPPAPARMPHDRERKDFKPPCLKLGNELGVKWEVKLGLPSGMGQQHNKPFHIGLSSSSGNVELSQDVTDAGPAPISLSSESTRQWKVQPGEFCPTAGEASIKLDDATLAGLVSPGSVNATGLQVALLSMEGKVISQNPGLFVVASSC